MPVMVRCPDCRNLNRAFIQMSRENLENLENNNNVLTGNRQQCGSCGNMILVENAHLVWQD